MHTNAIQIDRISAHLNTIRDRIGHDNNGFPSEQISVYLLGILFERQLGGNGENSRWQRAELDARRVVATRLACMVRYLRRHRHQMARVGQQT